MSKGERPDVSEEQDERGAVAGELAATMIGESRGLMAYSKQAIGRPHMAVTASPHATPASRQPIVCDRCSRVIDTPGVAIMRGRMVMHVRCDLRPSA
jgi:hypothetical protein